MDRSLGTLLLALGLLLVLSAPAAAQRDPFDPVIDTSVSTTTGGTNGAPTGENDPVTPPGSGAQADAFPNTGMDTQGWLAISYVLSAAGAALIVFARTRRTAEAPRRA
jgi:hypothetical protein